ncbi:MAG: cren protein [Candidatus Verstraetearchaeota archaeon]|uniref:Cren protein n=1 Tax=Thermoproteota archaeon TaxID=2056631 RepID=A0A523B9C3_9CREN|nr:cren protein [Candidatus Methanomethylicia archaeon]NHV60866.1 cren protein [Candidatus Verstraetearchaeota archaeon]TDA37492.1 MAG: cren protein [Candidatus Verstraetearchaeota archaeon]
MEASKKLEVEDIKDLARLVASTVSMGQPIYLVHFKHNEKHYYGVLGVYNNYYDKYGLPLFYYHVTDRAYNGRYVLVKMDEREEISFAEGVKPGWIAVPIINLKEKPEFVEI